MKSNIWTIVRKEFARFFGDKAMVFTTILMPGLLIYLIYSVMGENIGNKNKMDADHPATVYVENMPESVAPLFDSLPLHVVTSGFDFNTLYVDSLKDKECNLICVNFPKDFDLMVKAYDPKSGLPAPNVRIYYNSLSANSKIAFEAVRTLLDGWESSFCNRFNVNAQIPGSEESFDVATSDDVLGDILSQLIPMLLLTLMFSGCMAVAPASIAGEKERGTIATLLVTPMSRHELAIGKILSLSTFALLSGLSGFLGIILSLPKLTQADESVNLGVKLSYGMGDYVMLLVVLLSTVLVMISIISIISAYAKSVKAAGTMVMPLMIVIMFVGLIPMFGGGTATFSTLYMIPFYNSVQCMSGVFAYEPSLSHVIITVASNLCYTALAVYVLARMFNSERMMFDK